MWFYVEIGKKEKIWDSGKLRNPEFLGPRRILSDTCVGGGNPIPKRRAKENVVYPGSLATARGGVGDKASHLLESGVV